MTHWSAGSISANGINLHYYRTAGNKAPLVFAHGLTDNGLCWAPLVRTLEADYDCILSKAIDEHKNAPSTRVRYSHL